MPKSLAKRPLHVTALPPAVASPALPTVFRLGRPLDAASIAAVQRIAGNRAAALLLQRDKTLLSEDKPTIEEMADDSPPVEKHPDAEELDLSRPPLGPGQYQPQMPDISPERRAAKLRDLEQRREAESTPEAGTLYLDPGGITHSEVELKAAKRAERLASIAERQRVMQAGGPGALHVTPGGAAITSAAFRASVTRGRRRRRRERVTTMAPSGPAAAVAKVATPSGNDDAREQVGAQSLALRNDLRQRSAAARGGTTDPRVIAKLDEVKVRLESSVQQMTFHISGAEIAADMATVEAMVPLAAASATAKKSRDDARLIPDAATYFPVEAAQLLQSKADVAALIVDLNRRIAELGAAGAPAVADALLLARVEPIRASIALLATKINGGTIRKEKERLRDIRMAAPDLLQGRLANRILNDGALTAKAAFEAALDRAVDEQHAPPPAIWLKAIGYVRSGNYFMYNKVGEVKGQKAHASIYRDSVVAMEAGTPTTVQDPTATIVGRLLPTAWTGGAHVTIEGFSRFADGKNGSPHVYRGGPQNQGNWPGPFGPPTTWNTIRPIMQARLDNEVLRVEGVVDEIRVKKAIEGWPA